MIGQDQHAAMAAIRTIDVLADFADAGVKTLTEID
jgi:hypothetical protein